MNERNVVSNIPALEAVWDHPDREGQIIASAPGILIMNKKSKINLKHSRNEDTIKILDGFTEAKLSIEDDFGGINKNILEDKNIPFRGNRRISKDYYELFKKESDKCNLLRNQIDMYKRKTLGVQLRFINKILINEIDWRKLVLN